MVWHIIFQWRTCLFGLKAIRIHCPDLSSLSGHKWGSWNSFLTYSNLLLNPAWLSEAERLREGKLKWVICICVLFEAYHKNSHSGNIVNSFIHLSSLIYLGIKTFWLLRVQGSVGRRSLLRSRNVFPECWLLQYKWWIWGTAVYLKNQGSLDLYEISGLFFF